MKSINEWIRSDTTVDTSLAIIYNFIQTMDAHPIGIFRSVAQQISKSLEDTTMFTFDSLKVEIARQINQAIVTTGFVEEYKKQVNEIYLTTIAKGIDTFNSEQKETISYIASLCSFEFGPAVFEARSLSLLFDTTDYEDDCGEEIHYRKEDGLQAGTFNLYPNPTSDEFTLRYTLPENCDGDFILTDITGRILLHSLLNSDGSEQQFNTSDFASGMYLYSIRCNGALLKQDKVVIVR